MDPETPTPAPEPQQASPEPVAQTPPQEPEWNARENFQRLEQMLYTIATRMQAPQEPAPKSPAETSDEELWSLAQQGNRQAFEMYQERIADRRFDKRFGQVQQNSSVQSQVTALIQKYPEFADPNHPLTQRARAFKQVQIQLGDPANSMKTDLDAMLRAVADSRDLISPRTPVAPARTPAPGHFAPSHQRPASVPQGEPVTEAEARLAKHMNVKDPAGAKKRFDERQRNGASSVSPTVIAALDMVERQGNR